MIPKCGLKENNNKLINCLKTEIEEEQQFLAGTYKFSFTTHYISGFNYNFLQNDHNTLDLPLNSYETNQNTELALKRLKTPSLVGQKCFGSSAILGHYWVNVRAFSRCQRPVVDNFLLDFVNNHEIYL